jgi:hypothetical protein
VRKFQGWTKEQIQYFYDFYPTKTAAEIAQDIGKTKSSIQHMAWKLGMKKDDAVLHEIRSKANSGEKSGNFNGYRRKTPKGYITRYEPNHPSASKAGIVMEHRLIVEKALGVILPDIFDVHHINGDKTDNRLDNLAIITHSAHTALHNRKGKKHESSDNNWKCDQDT